MGGPSGKGLAGSTKGILCILGAGSIFSFTDAIAKSMMDEYPVGEVILFRACLLYTSDAADE